MAPDSSPWRAPADIASRLREAAERWDARDGTRRLFERDETLWTRSGESRWLDWLDLSAAHEAAAAGRGIAREAQDRKLTHALVVGMGGSSLCPDVLSKVFAPAGGLALGVLDTVDPARLTGMLAATDLARTLVVVSSKSGSTLEPNILRDLLFDRMTTAVGDDAPRRFVAITDPGSGLERESLASGFRVVHGVPGIGGRYSALSPFGMVPAALMGLDCEGMLARAEAMRGACRTASALENPGVSLGIALGALACDGRDKMTLLASPRLRPLGAWIEQLVAESTGKEGSGIVPVDGEDPLPRARYRGDRVFVALRLGEDPGEGYDARCDELAAAGLPVLACDVPTTMDVFAAFYRLEVATAVAGSLLRLDPFDQPDVEASKIAARSRLSGLSDGRAERVVLATDGGATLETAAGQAQHFPDRSSPAAVLRAHVASLERPDHVAFLCWRTATLRADESVARMRAAVSRARSIATTTGTGPRFLHSTGQLHKGGPPTTVVVQIVGPPSQDLRVPGRDVTFGQVLDAQCEGDFDVLSSRGRRALMVRVADDAALARLESALRDALR